MGLMDKWRQWRESKLAVTVKAKKKVALCLGGGGARGFAHIGALKAFEEAGLDFDICVGTSAGSIIGSLYAAGIKSDEMRAYAENLNMKDVHNGNMLVANDSMKIGKIVTNLIGNAEIEHLKKKFACVAVDLIDGRQVVIDSGKVGVAVSASSCVPLFFKPLIYNGRHLVDGGLLNNIPADVCKMFGADIVVTVDINPTRGGGTEKLGFVDIIKATFSIMSANSSFAGLRNSDIVIAPDLSKFSATRKDGYNEMIELGYAAAREKIAKINELINK